MIISRLGILLKVCLVYSEELNLSSKSKSTAECANSNGWVGPDQKYKCQSAKVNSGRNFRQFNIIFRQFLDIF